MRSSSDCFLLPRLAVSTKDIKRDPALRRLRMESISLSWVDACVLRATDAMVGSGEDGGLRPETDIII